MSENLKLTDPDIVEMDFPPYVEEYSPFPDVETDFNFEDNKEEIYLRNRIIAANEQVKLLKEEERKRLEKQEQFREMTEAAKAADRTVRTAKKKRNWDKLILLDSIIVVFGIIALIVALSGRTSKPPSSAYGSSYEEMETYDIWAEMKLAEAETNVYTPPEPFGEKVYREEHTIYTTDKMSYLFFPRYTWDNKFRVNVNIRNLTEEKYFIMLDGLYITDGKNRSYDYEMTRSNGYQFYTFEDEKFHADMEPIGLTFGSDGECSVTLEFPADWFENNSEISFGYDGGHSSVKPEDKTIKFIDDFETQIFQYIVTEISEVIIEEEEVSTEITEINDEMRKTTAVRDPFEEDGSSYIYNTAAMSYKFTPMYTENQYGQTSLSIYVAVKNLTDYDYAIVPNFVIDNNGDLTRASVNESSSSMHSSYAEQLADGEWVKTDTQFIAYDFDKNHLCSFRLQFLYKETTGVFSFAPSTRISREYAEKSDKDFQIPLEEILKYI